MTFLSLSPIQMAILLALTGGTIVALYWLRPPPQRVVVASTYIWSRVLKERRRRSDFWRWLVSLLLALVIGLAVASAVGKPEVEALTGRARRVAVVIDNSATMGARTESGDTRWERALEEARALVGEGSASSTYLVADTAGQLPASGYVSRRTALQRLDGLELSFGAQPRFPEGDALLSSASDDTEVVFIGDGVLVRDVPAHVQRISVFEPVDNVGITAFDIRPLPAEPTRYEAFLELVNQGAERERLALRIDGAGGQSIERSIELEPGQVRGQSLDLDTFLSGPVRALIDAEGDGYQADNVAYAYLETPRRVRTVLVTNGNAYLETLLGLDARVALDVVPPSAWPLDEAPDLFIFDGFAPREPPAAPALLFRPRRADWLPAPTGQELQELSLSGIESDHPLLRHVSFADVVIERAMRVEAAESQIVAGTTAQPIVVVGETPVRWAEVTFALADSNLPFQSGFAIFLSNAVSWLPSRDVMAASLGTVVLPFEQSLVTDIEGDEVETTRLGGRTAFTPSAPGLFSVRAAEGQLVVAANLLDPAVSAVNDSAFAGEIARPGGPLGGSVGWGEIWVGLLLLAVILVLGEWWTYNKRITV